jgi:hypothetical protein
MAASALEPLRTKWAVTAPALRVEACPGDAPSKNILHLCAPQAAEFLQAWDELIFIIQGIQPQAEFGDQVMAVDQVGHG